jgi:DNA recombination protein RmuC
MESLNRYEGHVKSLEESRQKAYGSLEEQIKSLNETQRALRDKTDGLVTALRRPEVRGRWGEISLKRVAELAGMVEHCDFEEQVSMGSESGMLRPDMLVHLPAEREVVVDAKVSLDAYLDALSAEDEAGRTDHMSRHARQMRTHMRQLSQKSYWEQLPRAPEFVVMFIPGESFLAAALEHDRTLLEDGMAKRVVLATPTTLIALLHAVAYGWRQEQLTRNAQEISELGKQLYERLVTFSDHFESVRKGLERANEAFNRAVGSMEARVFPAARRLRELGVAAGSEVAAVEPVETTPRVLSLPDTGQGDDLSTQ